MSATKRGRVNFNSILNTDWSFSMTKLIQRDQKPTGPVSSTFSVQLVFLFWNIINSHFSNIRFAISVRAQSLISDWHPSLHRRSTDDAGNIRRISPFTWIRQRDTQPCTLWRCTMYMAGVNMLAQNSIKYDDKMICQLKNVIYQAEEAEMLISFYYRLCTCIKRQCHPRYN